MLVSHIKKVKFNSPILVASGTYGYGHEVNDIADVDNLGGIVTKSVTLKPREGNPPPRIAETSSGMLNSIGLANLGVESFCNEKIPYLNELDTNVIINIAGSTFEEYENWRLQSSNDLVNWRNSGVINTVKDESGDEVYRTGLMTLDDKIQEQKLFYRVQAIE